jgi:hypothetical protein
MSKTTITRAEAEASFDRIAAIIAKAQADLRERLGDDAADALVPALQAIDQMHDELQAAPAITNAPARSEALA